MDAVTRSHPLKTTTMPRVKQFDEQEVLKKAMDLFWKQGYNATSIQDLVDYLGINRASLYDTFGGKKELFDKALDRYIQENNKMQKEYLAQEGPVRRVLKNMLENMIARTYYSNVPKPGIMEISVFYYYILFPLKNQVKTCWSKLIEMRYLNLFLLLGFLFALSACDSDIRPDSDLDRSLSSILTPAGTEWRVTYYYREGKELTDDFQGVILTFQVDGNMAAQVGKKLIKGNWRIGRQNGNETLIINLGLSGKHSELDNNWVVFNKKSALLGLTEDLNEHIEDLHLSKIVEVVTNDMPQ